MTAAGLQIGSRQWKQLLVDGAASLGLELSRRQIENFERFSRLLTDWNRKTNLTAITDPKDIVIKHFLDSIAVLPHLSPEGALLDIGTGGGFPGLPLKIMRPDQSMTLIDSSRKKISFVRHTIRQLDLPKIEALQSRAEDFARRTDAAGSYDNIVSRAVADIRSLLVLAVPLLSANGTFWAYKGPGIEELEDLPGRRPEGHASHCTFSSRLFSVERITYSLPFGGGQRSLLVFRSA